MELGNAMVTNCNQMFANRAYLCKEWNKFMKSCNCVRGHGLIAEVCVSV